MTTPLFLRSNNKQSLEEAKDSAMSANVLMNVSEFSSIDEATESLISMKSAFSDLSNMDIINRLNKVGNDFSISTDGIATALQDSAAALKVAGNNLDESIALITAGNSLIQNPSQVGKGMRTIALRLTGTKEAKQELEEMGEETETFIETQSKLRSTIMNATKVKSNNYMGFDILDEKGAYKSTFEILKGLSDLYAEMQENDKRTGSKSLNLLLETIAGKNRSNIAASVLANGQLLEDVYNESAFESVNSAIIENEKYLDSLSGKLAQLKTAWQELQTTMVDSSFLKGLTDMGTGALKGATGLMNQLSPTSLLMTMMGGVAGLNGIGPVSFDRSGKMKSWFKSVGDDTGKLIKRLEEQAAAKFEESSDSWGIGFAEFTEEVPDSIDKIKMSALDYNKAMEGLNISDDTREVVEGLKEQDATIGTITGKLRTNQTAWSQVKQVALGTLASMGVSFGISLGVDFFQRLADTPNSIAEAAAAMGNTIKEETKSIDDYKQKVQELWDTINDPNASIEEQTNARQELLNIQNELISNYGNEASLLTGVSASAEAAASSFEKLAEAQYKANMLAFNEGEGNGTIKNIAQQLDNAIFGFESNEDRMVSNMENQSITGLIPKEILKDNEEFGKELQKIFERNNLAISREAGDGGFVDKISGSARDMKAALEEAKLSLEDFQYTMSWNDYDEASKSINDYINAIDKVIVKNGDLYDQRNLYNNILNNEDMKKHYDNLKQYYDSYKEAFASGDSEAINDAIKTFTVEFNSTIAQAGENSGVVSYFKNMYSTMQKAMGEYNFARDFEKNIGGVKDSVQGYLDVLKDMSTEELTNFTVTRKTSKEVADSWRGLEQVAGNYDMTIQELIPNLENMGLVQSNAFRELLSNFQDYQYQISNMSQEELQIAYRIYADGMSFEELHDRIEQEKGLIEIGFDINDRSGLDEYNNIKSNSKSKHADYDQYRQMLETGKELAKQGRIGEEEFKKIAELFSENGMTDIGNWKENVASLGKYFTEDSKGAQQLVKDMSELTYTVDGQEKAFAELNEDGKTWKLNLDNMGELAEKLHIPMELLQVLLQNLQSYGFTDDYFGNMEDGANHLSQLYKDLADEETKLAQMRAEGKSEDLIKDQEAVVQGLKDSIETTRGGISNLISDAESAGDTTENVYNSQRESIQNLIDEYNRLKEAGASSYELDPLKEAIESKSGEFNIPVKFEADKYSIDDSIKIAEEKIQQAKDKLHEAKTKIEVDPSEVEEAENELRQAIEEKEKLEEPAIMKVDASQYNLNVDDANAINKLQEFMQAWNELQSLKEQQELGIHVDDSEIEAAEAKANSLAEELQGMNNEDVLVKMNIDTSSGDKNQIAPQVQNIDVSKVNETLGSIENPTVTFDGNTVAFDSKAKHVQTEMKNIDALRANPVINASINGLGLVNALATAIKNLHNKTITITTKRTGDKVKGGTVTEVNGTAHASGTAFATGGDWGAKQDETALVGELGAEMLVRGSHWQLIGENGAEFTNIKKGDINNIVSSYSDVCVKII